MRVRQSVQAEMARLAFVMKLAVREGGGGFAAFGSAVDVNVVRSPIAMVR